MQSLNTMLAERRANNRPCLIVGILNVTPDSFYDGGQFNTVDRALDRAGTLVSAGADVIDVGGESTRPGAEPVSPEEEKDRVLPVVESLTSEFSVPVSVDTTKPEVADEALRREATMINDVTGLEDPTLRDVVADHGCPVCIMHMQGTPRTMQENPQYDFVVDDVARYLEKRVDVAVESGIDREDIILDPGIGFGKTLEHNRKLLRNVRRFGQSDHLVLYGHSRKSFIGQVLDRDVDDRLPATLGVSSELIRQDVDLLRVHDVKEHADLLAMNRWLKEGGSTEDG